MSVYKCKMCGRDIITENGQSQCVCGFCGTSQTMPMSDIDQLIAMINSQKKRTDIPEIQPTKYDLIEEQKIFPQERSYENTEDMHEEYAEPNDYEPEEEYRKAIALLAEAQFHSDYDNAARIFRGLGNYRHSQRWLRKCILKRKMLSFSIVIKIIFIAGVCRAVPWLIEKI